MGAPMAGHLLDAGYHLTVYTRTRARAEDLLKRGAKWAETPAAAAEGADIAVSIVGMPEDVEAVHLGPEGTLAAATKPRRIVDMTTSRPSLAVKIHQAASKLGVGSVDAPVSGGDVGARNATLSIMVGGDEGDVEAVRPILDVMGGKIVRQGGPGAGQHTKMVNQILIATGMIGVCEGLIYAAQAGLNPETVIQSVGSGAAGSWSINNLGPRMIKRDFEPGFRVDHFIKDLSIALNESENMALKLPGLEMARRLYEELREQGYGVKGTQALLLAVEKINRGP